MASGAGLAVEAVRPGRSGVLRPKPRCVVGACFVFFMPPRYAEPTGRYNRQVYRKQTAAHIRASIDLLNELPS
jgi:hypothetical protein